MHLLWKFCNLLQVNEKKTFFSFVCFNICFCCCCCLDRGLPAVGDIRNLTRVRIMTYVWSMLWCLDSFFMKHDTPAAGFFSRLFL
jgi:hypothetical protein